MKRENNQELLAYAESSGNIFKQKYSKKYPDSLEIEEKSKLFFHAVHTIFSLYYALEYGHCAIDENQYKICRQHFNNLDALLREV